MSHATNAWVALEATADRGEQARLLRNLYDKFIDNERPPTGLRTIVAQSWQRAGQAGLNPLKRRADIALHHQDLEARWENHPLRSTLPALRSILGQATTESDHLLVLSDEQGVLLTVEGQQRFVEAARGMAFVRGADWSESGVGTNALGTALAVDHPVQIFSAEHYSQVVHDWQCSGAPVHDPETGRTIGVVDLTGPWKSAHPHTLALVATAARLAESELRVMLMQKHQLWRDAYHQISGGRSEKSLLVTAAGTVLERKMNQNEATALLNDETAERQELAGGAAFILRKAGRSSGKAPRPGGQMRLQIMQSPPILWLTPENGVTLTRRHAEILTILGANPQGLSAEQLALELYGERGKPVTVRAEVARLRKLLGAALTARPYKLSARLDLDVDEVSNALDFGDVEAALQAYNCQPLASSEAPRINEMQDQLESQIRRAVLEAKSPTLLEKWLEHPCGQADEPAAKELLELVEDEDPRAAKARARLRRIARQFD